MGLDRSWCPVWASTTSRRVRATTRRRHYGRVRQRRHRRPRTTYGAPFLDIDNLPAGDDVVATTYAGRFVYKVTGTTIVKPSDISVLDNTPMTASRSRRATRSTGHQHASS